MSRRRFECKRQLIEIYEEITSSCNWIVPAGCKNVDAFVVGAGNDGQEGNHEPGGGYGSGAGGRGGQCILYKDISVTPGGRIIIEIGNNTTNNYTKFMSDSYKALNGGGTYGGGSVGDGNNGSNGYNGFVAFNNSSLFPKPFGAAGGSSANTWNTFLENRTGGSGGSYGGGKGGDAGYDWASSGNNATWYGAGGGGGSCAPGLRYGSGGKGYQGIVILHYWKYR